MEASFLVAMYAAPYHSPCLYYFDCDLDNDLNEAFLLPRWHVASRCEDDVRHISKQKFLVASPESEAKGPHGHGIAEHSCRRRRP